MSEKQIPFYRPDLGPAEIDEVVSVLRSGWLTTGPRVKDFEEAFRRAVGATHAIALNSCTAALHLALEALGVRPGDGVLVPTMTFAATAEVVRYLGAVPVLVDCDPLTLNIDLCDAGDRLAHAPTRLQGVTDIVGIMPVHVGGFMLNVHDVQRFAVRHGLWVVEDAAHAFPAAWRPVADAAWQPCGASTATVTCFSFYANKTITTGEGGMAVTDDGRLASRMRLMSLHGLSHDAWRRYAGNGSWDYQIVAPGFKYNLTDIAAALGLHQCARAEQMRLARAAIAARYLDALSDIDEIELPPVDENRIHSWHLFPLKLRLERLSIDRQGFIDALRSAGIGCSVHWRPLHLHPYYQQTYGWQPEEFPVATGAWPRLVTLPLFSLMSDEDVDTVIRTVRAICARSLSPAVRSRTEERVLVHV